MEPLDDLIANSPHATFGPGVPEGVIADAERALGVSFPPSYRRFLATYGGGYIRGYELEGLFPVKPSERNPEDILVDAMRGRFTVWWRVRVNLRNVPPDVRPRDERPDPDYDPWEAA
jgi:hypothetical protein